MNRPPIPQNGRERAAMVSDIRTRIAAGYGKARVDLTYDRAELVLYVPTWKGQAIVQFTLTPEQMRALKESLPARPSPAETASARALLADFRYLEATGA